MRRTVLASTIALSALSACSSSTPETVTRDAAPDFDPYPLLPDRSEGPTCSGIDLFLHTCAALGCHWNGPEPGAGLDLVSPGLASRLVGVPSGCEDIPYAVPDAPADSFLLEKLTANPDRCDGPRMPLTGAELLPEQVECVTAWIASLPSP